MKAVLQNLKTGKLVVDDVPPPVLKPGGVLVRVRRSLISLGTERAVIALAKKGPIGKAKDRPDLARKVLNKAKQEGYWSTYKVVKNLISSPIPLGYSCAGEVIKVGKEVTEFRVGDRVACAGFNYANHAEINYVPRNLVVKVPDGLSYDAACFVTVGTIAMQSIRLAEIQLGETVVVMGLGSVGQITAQLARCSGATVLATDLDQNKVELAAKLGAHGIAMSPKELAGTVAEFTKGQGADAVLICAATKSNRPLQQAAAVSRLKGRVIVVGDVGMNIDRRACFEKELKLIVSRSYGPGRYDPAYEARGVDYPFAYVRWTEGRNMQSFLELLARKDIQVDPLVTHHFPIEKGEHAYQLVTGEKKERAIAIVLDYEGESPEPVSIKLPYNSFRKINRPINIGVIGAGQFAKGVLLPAFAKQKSVQFQAFCTSSGLSSRNIAERYNAKYCTSEPAEIINDKDVDVVLIATRHDLHTPLVIEALKAGKAVFVEKPLALTEQSLSELCEAVQTVEAPRLMVGFNRRFAPLAVRCREFFSSSREPLFVMCRINAGTFPSNTWVYDPVEGGGRILGEVCHFIDTISFLTGSLPQRIFAEELVRPDDKALNRDNVTVTLRMSNNSVGVIHYMANGDASVPKEYVEIFGGKRSAIMDNYRKLSLHCNNSRRRHQLFNQAKGHNEEVKAFINALEKGGPMPINWETLVAVTETTLLIHRSLDTGGPIDYEQPKVI
ncbi:MAG: bi-domain-containing oxidoreductase [Planctomycetota bacterium]|jgi:polar amino acid transport system substrate-binding protein